MGQFNRTEQGIGEHDLETFMALNVLARVGDRTRSYAQRKSDLAVAKSVIEAILSGSLPGCDSVPILNPLARELFWTARKIARTDVTFDQAPIIYSEWEERLELAHGLSWIMNIAVSSTDAGGQDFEKMLDAMARLGNAVMRVAAKFSSETCDHDPGFPRQIEARLVKRASEIAQFLFAEVEHEWRKERAWKMSATP